MDFQNDIEADINKLAQLIIDKGQQLDEVNYAKLEFYLSLRRVIKKQATPADIGLMDAINDTLQELEIIERSQTFIPKFDKDA